MNSPFKFLRRVRIHGGECGAVARALHHEVKSLSLYQADLEKSSGSTNERKQMSTKTTFKRIALATVASMGFGLLSSAPSFSANTVATAFTTAVTPSTTYLTVVSGGTTADGGVISFDVSNESVAANALDARGLIPQLETMTVTVIAGPTATETAAAVSIRPVTIESSAAYSALKIVPKADSYAAETFVLSDTKITTFEGRNFTPATGNTNGVLNRYSFGFAANQNAAVNKGYYTVRVRTQTANSRVIDTLVYVRFVTSIQDAGATITVAGTGTLRTNETLTYQTGKYYQATLADSSGGRIQEGLDFDADPTNTVDVASLAPALTARFVTSAGVAITGTTLSVADSGVAAVDHVAATTASPTTATLAETTNNQAFRNISNGVYGITSDAGFNGLTQAFTELATNKLQVRLTGASAQGELAITTAPANTSALTSVSTKIAATGVAAADTALTSTTASTTATKAYSLPLSAKSVTLTIDNGTTASQNLTTTTTWSGNYASANVSPAVSATGAVLTTATDADGVITRVITNSTPLAGAVATVVITGFANADHSVTVTLTWAAAAVSSVTVVEPVSGIHTKLKGTTNFVVSVKDQFGNGMSGELLQPLVGGSATSGGNYSATTTYATITTGADGTATWSLTDATGIADGTDSITFRSISNASAVSSAYTITYKTTVAAVGSFLAYFNNDAAATSAQTTTTVPTGGIYSGTAGNGSKLTLIYNVNLSDGTLDDADGVTTDAKVRFRFRALTSAGVPATGALVTVTASSGGHVLSSTGLPLSSRNFAVGTSGDVDFIGFATAPGAIKFTVTSGTASSEAAMWVAEPTGTAARTIAISGGSTGASNGDGVPMTVTVKDRYGNLVGNVGITATASGVGSFMGGSTQQSYTTDATGTYSFLATSTAADGGSGTFNVSINTAGSDATSLAGYYGSTEVDSTLAAGVSSASKAVTFTAGKNTSTVAAEAATAAAEAASDAAAEAIDAANAATDAANLAAEAADAATVAAEEARDAADAATAAVEELATQVATLMAALKAQITTLANTVAKIAKKVKA
jgi:hypothetical protein